jgi:SAM-dependent methyltransferase
LGARIECSILDADAGAPSDGFFATVARNSMEWTLTGMRWIGVRTISGGGNFMANAPIPPLPYPDKYFDVVYCLSVFTHLNESMQDLWIEELSRILKPGGVLLLTIYGKGVTEGLDEEAKGLLKLNGFVHRSSRKLRGLVPDWYQTTWHSRDYIENRLSTWLDDIHYYVVADGLQDFVAGRKSP